MTDQVCTPHAYIITGPTSGIGRATALELARHGIVVLVGRDTKKLEEVRAEIERKGGQAVSIVCDLSDMLVCAVRQQTSSIFNFRSLDWSTMRGSVRRSRRKAHRDGI